MNRLVGIPWGNKNPPEEANCLTLAIYAQKILWNKDVALNISIDWNLKNLKERSQEIEKEIACYAIQVEEPKIGCVGLMEICGFLHLITFVETDKVLHTILNGKSRISRYRGKEASIWSLLQ